jgi:cell division septation protein DedD
VTLNELSLQTVKRIGIEWDMKSAAFMVALSIAFFSTSGWSDVKYYKIPTPPKELDKSQVTTPDEPAEVEPTQTDGKKEQPAVSTPKKSASPKTGSRTEPSKSKPPGTVGTKKQKPRGPYITSLQIGSFQTLDQARKEEARLKALGIDVFIRHEKVRGKGMQYRVYIGKFNSKRQALDHEQEL